MRAHIFNTRVRNHSKCFTYVSNRILKTTLWGSYFFLILLMRKLTSVILSLYSSAPVFHTSSCQNHLLKYSSDILFINIEWFPTRMKRKFFSPPLKVCHSWLPSCCLKKPWNVSCRKRKRFHPCPHSLRSSLLCSFNSYSFLKTWLNDPLLWEAFRGHYCTHSCLRLLYS